MSAHIEETLAHLVKTIEELSDVIARQDTELRSMRRELDILLEREKDRALEASGGVILGDERPPHY